MSERIEIDLPPQDYERLAAIARTRRVSLGDAAQLAVVEWLERQAQAEQGRSLLRELGEGLGKGPAPHDAARRHDEYLTGCDRL